jgi:predicted DNA-binding transcriptional regulator AlpA
MGNISDDRWLSRQELADRFGLPVKTLAQWASKGTGPRYARMGRHVRYRLSDVIDWEAARFDDSRPRHANPGAAPNHNFGQLPAPRRAAHTWTALGASDDPHHL